MAGEITIIRIRRGLNGIHMLHVTTPDILLPT